MSALQAPKCPRKEVVRSSIRGIMLDIVCGARSMVSWASCGLLNESLSSHMEFRM